MQRQRHSWQKVFDKRLQFKSNVNGGGCGDIVLVYHSENWRVTQSAPENTPRRQPVAKQRKYVSAGFAALPGATYGLRLMTSHSTHTTHTRNLTSHD